MKAMTKETGLCKGSDGYHQISIDGTMKKVHRVLYEKFHGQIPDKMDIDHINRVKTDNRISNLRLVTKTQNQQNRVGVQANNKSGYKGVSWCRRSKKWMAQIRVNTKTKFLGYYTDPKEAAKVYNQNATKYFGEFAHLNEGVK